MPENPWPMPRQPGAPWTFHEVCARVLASAALCGLLLLTVRNLADLV